jgi:hypothetical protein
VQIVVHNVSSSSKGASAEKIHPPIKNKYRQLSRTRKCKSSSIIYKLVVPKSPALKVQIVAQVPSLDVNNSYNVNMLKRLLPFLQTMVQAICTGQEASFTEFYPKKHIHDKYTYKMTVSRLGPMAETACQAMTAKLGAVTGKTEAVVRLVKRPNRKQLVAHLTVGQLTTHYAASQGNVTVVRRWKLLDFC